MIGPSEGELLARVAVATGLGLVVGAERELSAKPAGMRTYALVALGAAAFTVAGYGVLSLGAVTDLRPDVGRVAAQVASGIGFLGAGIILIHRGRVRGVTSAAELWGAAAIGVLAGLGLLLVAVGSAVLTLVVVAGLRPIERWMERFRRKHHVEDVEGDEFG